MIKEAQFVAMTDSFLVCIELAVGREKIKTGWSSQECITHYNELNIGRCQSWQSKQTPQAQSLCIISYLESLSDKLSAYLRKHRNVCIITLFPLVNIVQGHPSFLQRALTIPTDVRGIDLNFTLQRQQFLSIFKIITPSTINQIFVLTLYDT